MTTDLLRQRAKALRLYGLLAHWTEIADAPWLPTLLQWEEDEHIRRSLERRMKSARLGRFKAIDEFDWNWPTRCDRGAIEAILTLEFITEAANVVLIGPNEPVTLCTS
jgi:IstB-like ATP binding protein